MKILFQLIFSVLLFGGCQTSNSSNDTNSEPDDQTLPLERSKDSVNISVSDVSVNVQPIDIPPKVIKNTAQNESIKIELKEFSPSDLKTGYCWGFVCSFDCGASAKRVLVK